MLKARVITASIMAAVVGAVVFAGTVEMFQVLVAVVFAVACWEWSKLADISNTVQRGLYVGLMMLAGGSVFYLAETQSDQFIISFLTAACVWWAVALLWVQSYPSSAILWGRSWTRCLMGAIVLIPAFVSIALLRTQDSGHWLIFMIVTLVAAADIGAYFSGKAFGKRKLAPKVSPGKSWEGVIGGLIWVIVVTCLFNWLNGRSDYLVSLAVALPTAFASVLGDLLESMVKRHRGVKDSGKILPGHGGVLDRIDGLTAAAPVFALAIFTTGWGL